MIESQDFSKMLEEFKEQGQSKKDNAMIEELSSDITDCMVDKWDDVEKLNKEEILEANLTALDNMGIIPSGSTDRLLSIIQTLNENAQFEDMGVAWLSPKATLNVRKYVRNH